MNPYGRPADYAQQMARRDDEIVRFCAEPRSTSEIAIQFALSPGTVHRVLAALRAGGRLESWWGKYNKQPAKYFLAQGVHVSRTTSGSTHPLFPPHPALDGERRRVSLTDSRPWGSGGQAIHLAGSREYAMEVMW